MKRHIYVPWKVYAAPLRPNFPAKIIEIHDARGSVIVCWGGFDATDFSYTQNLRNARRIVKAVNAEAESAR